MNVLMLSLLYPPKTLAQVSRASRDGLQNQINNYQWAFVEGVRQSLAPEESLSLVNCLPVGIFPLYYRKAWLPSWEETGYQELGSINIPAVKQWQRHKKAARAISAWVQNSPDNRQVLVYSLYLPYMQAVAKVKKSFPDIRATVIVTDLPNELGIASGRKGLLQKIEYAMGNRRMELCSVFDGFVLLTKAMASALPIADKQRLLMEGLILPDKREGQEMEEVPAQGAVGAALKAAQESKRAPIVLYTGTLNRELGIGELLEAFEGLPQVDLWLCGKGDMEAQIQEAAREHPNIQYFGFVDQRQALAMQAAADVLINPRSPRGEFTKYSFPSKTLEYMRSGKPVLCYRLEGIPAEYGRYLMYIQRPGAVGIRSAVRKLLALPSYQRQQLGQAAQAFVEKEKLAHKQCQKLLRFMRGLT